jgi:hypothetical protein
MVTVSEKTLPTTTSTASIPIPKSFWIHDDSINEGGHGRFTVAHQFLEKATCLEKGWRHALISIAVFSALVIILGTVLGTQLGRETASSDDDSASAWTSPTSPGPGHISTHIPTKDRKLSLGKNSQLAAVRIETPNANIVMLVFQVSDQELAAIEWRNEDPDVYHLKQRTKGAALPMPALGSPLRLLVNGPDDDVHLFYLGETWYPVHLVQAAAQPAPRYWLMQPMSLSNGEALQRASKDMRLYVALFAPDGHSTPSTGSIGLVYKIEGQTPTFSFLSGENSTDGTWESHNLAIRRKELDMVTASSALPRSFVRPSSSTMMGNYRRARQSQFVSIIWEGPDENGLAALDIVDCEAKTSSGMVCFHRPAKWMQMTTRSLQMLRSHFISRGWRLRKSKLQMMKRAC